MESPKYNNQPVVKEEDDAERWVNEGGHLLGKEDAELDSPDELLAPTVDANIDQSQ